MPPIYDLETWAPLLRLNRIDRGGHAAGMISRGSWSVPVPRPAPVPGRAFLVEDMQEEWDAVGGLREALEQSGLDGVSFVAQAPSPGRVVLHLLERGPAVQSGIGPYPGSLILVDGAVPEPCRRLPEPVPEATPAESADPALLERTLRERLPDATAATEAEIAATEARLGVTLPDELKAIYRVTRGDWEQDVTEVTGCQLFPLDELYIADAASRLTMWQFAATEAVATGPELAVQQLVGSPGRIAFGDNGGGDRFAVDLTPGPAGHTGQIIFIGHEENIGADLYADSLTDMMAHRLFSKHSGSDRARPDACRL